MHIDKSIEPLSPMQRGQENLLNEKQVIAYCRTYSDSTYFQENEIISTTIWKTEKVSFSVVFIILSKGWSRI